MTFSDVATSPSAARRIGVAVKHVPLRVEVNPLTGAVSADDRVAGASPADEAALEYALRLGESWGWEVVCASVGDRRCETVLRDALARGARSAARVDLPADAASPVVAAGLAAALGDCAMVVCGAASLDRGSGSVPAYLADEMSAAQALGLVSVTDLGPGRVEAERRLDGGRRERLEVRAPGVLSVEPAGIRLRRASLPAVLRSRDAVVEVLPAPVPYAQDPARGTRRPYRPRPKKLPAPARVLSAGDRVLALTGALTERRAPAVVRTTDATVAADTLLEFLRDRSYPP